MSKKSIGDLASDRIIDDAECDHLTSLSRTTRFRLRRRGEFPDPVEISPGRKGWFLSDVLTWIESRRTQAA